MPAPFTVAIPVSTTTILRLTGNIRGRQVLCGKKAVGVVASVEKLSANQSVINCRIHPDHWPSVQGKEVRVEYANVFGRQTLNHKVVAEGFTPPAFNPSWRSAVQDLANKVAKAGEAAQVSEKAMENFSNQLNGNFEAPLPRIVYQTTPPSNLAASIEAWVEGEDETFMGDSVGECVEQIALKYGKPYENAVVLSKQQVLAEKQAAKMSAMSTAPATAQQTTPSFKMSGSGLEVKAGFIVREPHPHRPGKWRARPEGMLDPEGVGDTPDEAYEAMIDNYPHINLAHLPAVTVGAPQRAPLPTCAENNGGSLRVERSLDM